MGVPRPQFRLGRTAGRVQTMLPADAPHAFANYVRICAAQECAIPKTLFITPDESGESLLEEWEEDALRAIFQEHYVRAQTHRTSLGRGFGDFANREFAVINER